MPSPKVTYLVNCDCCSYEWHRYPARGLFMRCRGCGKLLGDMQVRIKGAICCEEEPIVEQGEFKCKQCGNCCVYFGTQDGLEITQEDFQRWKDADAFYILAFVRTYWRKSKEYASKKIWRNPRAKNRFLPFCPFLYEISNGNGGILRRCGIHELKPEDCREFITPDDYVERLDCRGYLK